MKSVVKNFSILSKYDKVTGISDAINDFMTENFVPKNIADMFQTCLLEALNNIIEHAYKEDFTQSIDISIEITAQKVSVTLFDTGIPRENTKRAIFEFDPSDIEGLPEGGMGLYIIENLMDKTDYKTENSVNKFTLIKYL